MRFVEHTLGFDRKKRRALCRRIKLDIRGAVAPRENGLIRKSLQLARARAAHDNIVGYCDAFADVLVKVDIFFWELFLEPFPNSAEGTSQQRVYDRLYVLLLNQLAIFRTQFEQAVDGFP